MDRIERARAARHELERALQEQDVAQRHFERAIGTSAEMGAYVRLRRASRRLADLDAESEVRRSEEEAIPGSRLATAPHAG